jgi:replicative DNA helicase
MRGSSKRPQLSDLRESGAIEQDADMVAFIYRPEYYGFDNDETGNSTKGVAELIIAKHRNGPTTSVNLKFIDRLAKFTDADFSEMPLEAVMPDFPSSSSSGAGSVTDYGSNRIIRGSRMNDMKDDEDVPF